MAVMSQPSFIVSAFSSAKTQSCRDAIFKNQANGLTQALFGFLDCLPLSIGAGNFSANSPIAAFGGLFNDCGKLCLHSVTFPKPPHAVNPSPASENVLPNAKVSGGRQPPTREMGGEEVSRF